MAEKIDISVPLAETYKPSDKNREKLNGWVYSEKYDGCRAYYDYENKSLYSRAGNNFNMPKEFMKNFPKYDLDGELYSMNGDFSRLSGILNTKHKTMDMLEGITYKVFDIPNAEGTFEERMPDGGRGILFKSSIISPVTYNYISPDTDLESILEETELRAGEGLILRNPKAEYERKRSKNLLKYVSSYTSEAVVVGYNEGKGRNAGRLGSLQVIGLNPETGSEMSFKLSGCTDDQRNRAEELYPIGTSITYKYREVTKTGKPRFPVFLRIRDEI